ncbi:ferritin-like domain-containing protein [Chengkuizengella axinellae]|uniref:ferritin-like domain-containing protein n=1 Tax=Chengkuizengella axinellae TaxID=3064388 RepID=UPI003527B3BB
MIGNFKCNVQKIKQFHWFVIGEHFFELHKASEELYGEVATFIDEVAEKMLAANTSCY